MKTSPIRFSLTHKLLSNTARINKIKVSFVFLNFLSKQTAKVGKSNLEARGNNLPNRFKEKAIVRKIEIQAQSTKKNFAFPLPPFTPSDLHLWVLFIIFLIDIFPLIIKIRVACYLNFLKNSMGWFEVRPVFHWAS